MKRALPDRKTRIIVTLLSTVFTLVVGEAGARVYATLTSQQRGIDFDPELGWRPLPNIRKVGRMWGDARPARTNSRGWRDPEHSFEKPLGVQRIVVLGDSLTFGIAVDDGERFTDVLGRRFSGLEVINLGVTGYGTDQELRVLELEGFRYQPDIVMLVVTLSNDLQDIGYTRRDLPKPYYLLEKGEPRLWKPRLTWDVRLRSASYLAEFLFQQTRDRVQVARWARVPGAGDPLPLFTALVQRMANESAQRGVHFFAVLAYSRHDLQTEPTEPERLAVTALGAAHIVMLDSYAPLAPRVRAGETLYLPEQPDAIHWNARGNAVISETIGRMLIRQGWLSSQVGTQIPSDDVAPRVDPEDLRNDRARERVPF